MALIPTDTHAAAKLPRVRTYARARACESECMKKFARTYIYIFYTLFI